MKALCIHQPERCSIIEVPEPGPLRPGEVLLRVRRIGFCGSDLTTYRGLNPLISYPRIPGHELAATIEELGPEVPPQWRVGQEILVSPYTSCGTCSACRCGRANACRSNETLGVQRNGAMTELLVVPHEKLFAAEKLGLTGMALVEPLTVGFHAVARGQVDPADTVGVLGCGAIGLGAIAGASARGARVIAIDIDDGKLDLAGQCGATECIHSADADLHASLQSLTDGHGPDVMIEAVGLPETFRSCVEETGFAGRVVYIGYAKAPVEYDTKLFVMKELDIRGSRNALPGDFHAVIDHLGSGVFPVDRVITREVSLDEAPGALHQWHLDPQSVTRIHVNL